MISIDYIYVVRNISKTHDHFFNGFHVLHKQSSADGIDIRAHKTITGMHNHMYIYETLHLVELTRLRIFLSTNYIISVSKNMFMFYSFWFL